MKRFLLRFAVVAGAVALVKKALDSRSSPAPAAPAPEPVRATAPDDAPGPSVTPPAQPASETERAEAAEATTPEPAPDDDALVAEEEAAAAAEARGRGGPRLPRRAGPARRRDIPVQFLEQLFATLRRAGVLRSQRGVKGGYLFARDPSEVTVLEVVELLDGPLGRDAEGILAEAATAARAVLESTTIADLVERETREAGIAMYQI